ncbi:MAG: glycosyltransferase [Casimicrobiaceae bacterium]
MLRVEGEFNFSRLINRGVAESTGDLLLLLNDDIEANDESSQWLGCMVGQLLEPGVGVVGPRLRYPDGRLQHAGIYAGMASGVAHRYKHLPRHSRSYHGRAELAQTVFAVTGACLLIRRTHFEQVGGLDEVTFPITYNDVDLCLKVRERFGARTVYVPAATLTHAESVSRGRDEADPAKLARQRKALEALYERWPCIARLDPAHSPNLGDDAARLDLRWPPAWPEPLSGLLA